jgi:predicted phosphodiesterase
LKIALITDTHFGVRNDNQIFAEYFRNFYETQFFPYIDKHNIKTIIHLGDLVDRRKYVNFVTSNNLYENFIKPIEDRQIDFHCILGNHDLYFKNTLSVNALKELYRNNNSVKTIDTPTELEFDSLKVLLVPWICSENYNECLESLKITRSDIVMGHFEFNGFEMHRGSFCEHGLSIEPFAKFEKVFSGHFHHKSERGNIHYLGSPYEITWSDYDDPKGFHVFDTDTREIEFIQNTTSIFHKIDYDDSEMKLEDLDDIDFEIFENCYIKLVVKNKTNPYLFDMFVEKVEKAGVANLQIVENLFYVDNDGDSAILDEAKSTLDILDDYISTIETKTPKKKIKNLFHNLYQEALNSE